MATSVIRSFLAHVTPWSVDRVAYTSVTRRPAPSRWSNQAMSMRPLGAMEMPGWCWA